VRGVPAALGHQKEALVFENRRTVVLEDGQQTELVDDAEDVEHGQVHLRVVLEVVLDVLDTLIHKELKKLALDLLEVLAGVRALCQPLQLLVVPAGLHTLALALDHACVALLKDVKRVAREPKLEEKGDLLRGGGLVILLVMRELFLELEVL